MTPPQSPPASSNPSPASPETSVPTTCLQAPSSATKALSPPTRGCGYLKGVRTGGPHREGSRRKRQPQPWPVCTCKAICPAAVTPSPLAITVIVAGPTLANPEALNVSVTRFVLTHEAGVTGFADQPAVTPAGSPLTAKRMFPLNDPPVPIVRLTVPEAPCATTIELDAAVSVSVGGCIPVTPPAPAPQLLTSTAPSTDPSPVARLYSPPLAVNPVTPGTLLFPDGVA